MSGLGVKDRQRVAQFLPLFDHRFRLARAVENMEFASQHPDDGFAAWTEVVTRVEFGGLGCEDLPNLGRQG